VPHDYTDIQNDFYEGIDEIFTELFSDRVFLHLMDSDAQEAELDIYREAAMDSEKLYLPPVALVGSYSEMIESGDGIPPEQAEPVGAGRFLDADPRFLRRRRRAFGNSGRRLHQGPFAV
jgi:hypothetical protein